MRVTRKAVTVVAWGTAAAIACNLFLDFRWWHPICMSGAEAAGPYGYAIGFPLPFAQPTGISSLSYLLMPHVYALDTVLLASAAGLLVLVPVSLIDRVHMRAGQAAGILGVVALMLAVVSQSLLFSTGWIPVSSIATRPETLLDYRPDGIVDHARVPSCSY
ncbi:MAG: hypothetical protein ACXU82_16010 [Caulobacteraceae bacterium]